MVIKPKDRQRANDWTEHRSHSTKKFNNSIGTSRKPSAYSLGAWAENDVLDSLTCQAR